MKHPTDGVIRAYQDGELAGCEQEQVRVHLAQCAQCQEQAQQIEARSARTGQRLAILAPDAEPSSTRVARARLEAHITEKEQMSMWHRLFQRSYRPAWAAAAIVVVLAVSMSFAPVRALASRFFDLFRVEQITAVQVGVSLDDLSDEMAQYATALESLLADEVEIEGSGEPVAVESTAEAAALAGFPVRLPTRLGEPSQIIYRPGRTVRFEVDRDRWQVLLDEMGYRDMVLPESLDGGEVAIHVPDMVAAGYGPCGRAEAGPGACTMLVQGRNPSIEVPPGVDMEQLGPLALQTLGMSAQEAADFGARVDWLTTLVIPVPQGATYHDLDNVDGVHGIALEDPHAEADRAYTLLWVKDGILYVLGADEDLDQAIEVANSMQ